MLDVKYLYKLTYANGEPTSFKASKYIGNPIYFECKYYSNLLFEMLYGDNLFQESSKIFKVVPLKGEI